MDRKKVIIIGSGLGGLSSGVVLAKNGYRVTVLEQDALPGGCLQCFCRRGVKFETGMHFIGSADEGQILNKMMRYLEIDGQVELARLDTDRYNVVSLQGEEFEFANGREAFIEQKVLVGDLPLYAAVRDKTPFSVHAFIMDFYNRSTFRFVGGSDVLVRALTDVLSRHGGEVRTRSRVTRIVCDATHATGVEVNGGEFLPADYVISATHPMRTMEMLGDTHLIRPAFRKRIASIPQTVGGFSVYLHFKENKVPYMNHNYFAYDTDTPWGCEQYDEDSWPKGYLYMHVCDRAGQEFARSGILLTYMRMDELSAWQDTVPGRRGADYEAFVDGRARKLIAALDRRFPGIREDIECFYVSSPLTYRDYTGTQDGSIYGVAKDITLGSAGRVPHKTRIPNVFMTGQNVNSHGMLGVIVGTMMTCGEFLTPKYIYEQILEANK